MYDVIFSGNAKKQFLKLEKIMRERIVSALERVRIRPAAYVTKLVGDPAFKLRVGDYRVLLEIDEGKLVILVIKLGHRKNIYE